MPDKKTVTGLKEEDLNKKGRESLENALSGKLNEIKESQDAGDDAGEGNEGNQQKGSQQQQGTSQQQQQGAQQSGSEQDATGDENDLSEYDNILTKTFGFDESNITDEARKVAKSWAEIQSKATKAQQEKKQYQKQLTNFNKLFEKDPSLYEHAEAVANGQPYENPNNSKQDSKSGTTSNNQKGQLNTTDVDQQTLIDQGYLDPNGLDELEGLAKDRKIAQAEIQYEKDRALSEYKEGLQKTNQEVKQQAEQERVTKINKKRLTEGLDNFVKQTGYNLNDLDDETFEQIQQKAIYDRDPSDPRLVDVDAFPSAAERILRRKGMLDQSVEQNQAGKKDLMGDTGKTVNKNTQKNNQPNSIVEELNKRAKQQFGQSNDPKAQFFQ